MRRHRLLLHLTTALLLTLQLARGTVDLMMCIHEDDVHLTYAHPECCDGACDADTREEGRATLGHDDCDCLDLPLAGQADSTPGPAPTRTAPEVPLLPRPATAVLTNNGSDPPAPPPSPPSPDSLLPLLRRSVELRI